MLVSELRTIYDFLHPVWTGNEECSMPSINFQMDMFQYSTIESYTLSETYVSKLIY